MIAVDVVDFTGKSSFPDGEVRTNAWRHYGVSASLQHVKPLDDFRQVEVGRESPWLLWRHRRHDVTHDVVADVIDPSFSLSHLPACKTHAGHSPVIIKFPDFLPDISSEYLRSIDPRNSSDTKWNACYFSLQYSYILSQLWQLCSSVDSNGIIHYSSLPLP